MNMLNVVEGVAVAVAIYVGVRVAVARRIAIVSEGGLKTFAWIEGASAIVVGCGFICFGFLLFAASLGVIHVFPNR